MLEIPDAITKSGTGLWGDVTERRLRLMEMAFYERQDVAKNVTHLKAMMM